MFFELKMTVILKKSTHHLDMQEHIGSWINRSQLTDKIFKKEHYDKKFKHFVFSNLYPLEKDGIYQQGRVYIITIRSSQEDILNRIHLCMKKTCEDNYFQLISSEEKSKNLLHINEITNITPVIVTIDRKPWTRENNIERLIDRLHANAEKKFKDLYPGSKVQGFQPFIQGILLINQKPIATSYKGRKLLGNKFQLLINEDEYSQKLANVVLGSGLGEKGGSIGAGFCLEKCME